MSDTTERRTVYQIVTSKIIDAIDKGVAPWRLPWSRAEQQPKSLHTGKDYRGVNVWLLALEQWDKGYEAPLWLTYKQAQERGGQVRKGERSTLIVFWKFAETQDKQTGQAKTIPVLRYYNVFNAAQCDGLTYPTPEKYPTNPIETAQAIVDAMPSRPEIRTGAKACYCLTDDRIEMPSLTRFPIAEDYYSTLFHEMAHSTGHESRLNRTLQADRASGAYAREELIAELTAAYLCADCGIIDRTIDQSAAYLAGWRKRLEEDDRLFVTAAGAAQRAHDFIRGTKPAFESETDTTPEAAVISNH